MSQEKKTARGRSAMINQKAISPHPGNEETVQKERESDTAPVEKIVKPTIEKEVPKVDVSLNAEPKKVPGVPKGTMRKTDDPEAPYGRRKDGTPRKAPGSRKKLKDSSLQTYNITGDVVSLMDKYMDENDMSKSELVRLAVVEFLAKQGYELEGK